jgi:hypothetical protein
MKTGLYALGTAENESGEQNMKTGPYALDIAKHEKDFWSAKHENVTLGPRYRRKRVRERKT